MIVVNKPSRLTHARADFPDEPTVAECRPKTSFATDTDRQELFIN